MNAETVYGLVAIVGLALITLLARAFFMLHARTHHHFQMPWPGAQI